MIFIKLDFDKLKQIKKGNILYALDIFENGYNILRDARCENKYCTLNFPANFKGRPILVYSNKKNIICGFELRTKKPMRDFVALEKKDRSFSYVLKNRIRCFKWEQFISDNEISDTFIATNAQLKKIVNILFNDYFNIDGI